MIGLGFEAINSLHKFATPPLLFAWENLISHLTVQLENSFLSKDFLVSCFPPRHLILALEFIALHLDSLT